jgi:SAM-dependent methyltransferase
MLWVAALCASAVLTNVLMIACARAQDHPIPEVPYVPTPEKVVEEMLRLANVGKGDVVYDLGCGDGRIVITAALKYGARGVGVDIDPERIKESNENARKAGVADRVKFLQQDLFETDFREATVVTLYLLPDVNLRLRPKLLRELKPGTRIVSHAFDMGDWKPEKVVKVPGEDRERTIYFWVTPAGGNRKD